MKSETPQSFQKDDQKGFKTRLYPNKEQKEKLDQTLGCCRLVYNTILNEINEAVEEYFKDPENNQWPIKGKHSLADHITRLRAHPDYWFLNDVSSRALRSSLVNMTDAFKRAYGSKKVKDSGKPKFRRKRDRQSYSLEYPKFEIQGNSIRLEKIPGFIKMRGGRMPPGTPSSITVSKTPSGEYYASFLCEFEPKKTSGTKVTGIDAGIAILYTLSDGTTIDNPRFFIQSALKLARLQRQLSRKQKGSANREKARIKLAFVYQHVAAQRREFIHRLTTILIRQNQAIIIESLKIANMVKNRHLAKHIMDAAWGEFFRQLFYKARFSQHCEILVCGTFFPSTHVCANTMKKIDFKLDLSQREWLCPHCGEIHDRDLNAAQVLRNVGQRFLDREPTLRTNGAAPILIDANRYLD